MLELQQIPTAESAILSGIHEEILFGFGDAVDRNALPARVLKTLCELDADGWIGRGDQSPIGDFALQRAIPGSLGESDGGEHEKR